MPASAADGKAQLGGLQTWAPPSFSHLASAAFAAVGTAQLPSSTSA